MKTITYNTKDSFIMVKRTKITFNQVVGGSNPPCLTKNFLLYVLI
nr:MAG TPA: hypothetical protein [Inoviridae sp.]